MDVERESEPANGETAPLRSQRPGAGSNFYQEQVTEVRHWTGKLFSFKTTRSQGLRFESGQFVMIGLMVDGKPLMRAYSVVSSRYDDWLEFLSIKVPDGPLTSRLRLLKPGDTIYVSKKPTGTLLLDALKPGRRLYLFCTGTGFAPFGSIIRDPETYERFQTIVVAYGCRHAAELAFATNTVLSVRGDQYLSTLASGHLLYYTTVSREPHIHTGRLTTAIETGELWRSLGLPPLDPEFDRAMICGNPGMLAELRAGLQARRFTEGGLGEPGEFVIEKAFVER